MIDPINNPHAIDFDTFLRQLKTHSTATSTPTLTMPTSTPTSVAPIPTVFPGNDYIHQVIHGAGSRTLWVVTVLMGISSVVFYILAGRQPLTKRVFHTLASITTTISFIVYLALATGTGITHKHDLLHEHHTHVPNTPLDLYRQVFWLRYINWFLTEPLSLLNLSLLSGLPGANLLIAVAADYTMLGTGVLGTFAGHRPVRWVWFAISAIGYLVMVYQVGVNGSRAVSGRDSQTRKFWGSLVTVAGLVRVLYPVTIAAGALALKINLDTETILFAILDIVSQGLVGYWLLLSHDSSADIALHVDGFWSQGLRNEGAIRINEEEGA